jgi:hypothetical protein
MSVFTVHGRVGDGDVGHLGRDAERLHPRGGVEAAPVPPLTRVQDIHVAQPRPASSKNWIYWRNKLLFNL